MTRPTFPWFIEQGKGGAWNVVTHEVWKDGTINVAHVATFEMLEEAEYIVKLVNAELAKEVNNG